MPIFSDNKWLQAIANVFGVQDPGNMPSTASAAFSDAVGSGSITTQNLNPNSGVATAGSTVAVTTGIGHDTASIQVSGTYTGALTVQGTIDNQNWVALGGVSLVNINTGAGSATIASASTGIWQVDVSGLAAIRVTALAAVTGTATVTVRASSASALVGLDSPLPAGSNTIGTVNATTTPASPSALSLNSAATTNATSVKTTAGSLYEITASNVNAAARYLKLYNKASAPTVGTDTPILIVVLPPTATTTLQFGATGKRFTTGIAYAITGAMAISDTTAIAAGDVQLHGSYI